MPDENIVLADQLLSRLRERGLTVAVAESLTGGMLMSQLVSVPGASICVRGGVVAYATALKHELLGADADLLARVGAVDPEVAQAMASGVRRVCATDVGIATTGVAGPDSQDGHPVGTVCVAVIAPEVERVTVLSLPGDRAQIRDGASRAALQLALSSLS